MFLLKWIIHISHCNCAFIVYICVDAVLTAIQLLLCQTVVSYVAYQYLLKVLKSNCNQVSLIGRH